MDQIEKMYGGDLNAVNALPATSPLYSSAMQLNMIRDGIKIAVEEGIKSERTKVELITNVSHDQDAATSIISYVELLKAEPDLPPHVKDYIEVIAQKSGRLRCMIQDIFDVSKAATGNITLPEYLSLDKLLRQTPRGYGCADGRKPAAVARADPRGTVPRPRGRAENVPRVPEPDQKRGAVRARRRVTSRSLSDGSLARCRISRSTS